jgi:hypothetical protein
MQPRKKWSTAWSTCSKGVSFFGSEIQRRLCGPTLRRCRRVSGLRSRPLLLHVGYKVAAEMGPRYTAMLEKHAAPIAADVTRHVLASTTFGRCFSGNRQRNM